MTTNHDLGVQTCPQCGEHISPAVGMWWDDPSGSGWVGTCIRCNTRTGRDWTYGIDPDTGLLVEVEGYMIEEY